MWQLYPHYTLLSYGYWARGPKKEAKLTSSSKKVAAYCAASPKHPHKTLLGCSIMARLHVHFNKSCLCRILYWHVIHYNLQLQQYLFLSTVVSETLRSPGRTSSSLEVTIVLSSFLEPGQELKQLSLPSLLVHIQRNISCSWYNKFYSG